jgi:protein SCO1/2
MNRNQLVAVALASTGLLTLGLVPALAADSPHWGPDYFPNVTLITQDKKPVKFYDDLLKGKKVAIYLMYTTCKYACPLETARLAQVQRYLGDRVGKDIYFYSISIDPTHDTPEVMKSYAEKYHAGPGWLFLTGKAADIELISKKLGLYSPPDPSNPDGHMPSLMIGNVPEGQWMKNSALDNPRFLSIMIGQFLDDWKTGGAGDGKTKTYADAGAINFDRGQYLFGSKCAPCHTLGRGDSIGPDLVNVTRTRDHEWLVRYLTKPDEMLAHGDPIAVSLFKKYKQTRMPNLFLGDVEIQALIGLLDRKVLYYACPMHPHTHSDRPGKGVCCGMRLEPVFASSAPAAVSASNSSAAKGRK